MLAFNRQDAEFAAALRRAGALALPPYIARPAGPLPEDQRRLPDHLRRARRCGGGADRGTAFHAGAARGAGAARHRACHRHAACRRRHIPAGAHRRRHATPHARRTRRDHAGSRCRDQRGARAGGRVVAVGTTSLRLLESAAWRGRMRSSRSAATPTLFILPGYRFRAVDLLLTNFHLPRSTLFMLVCAFAGTSGCARRMRMRSRRGIASTPMAMRACWSRPIHPLPQGEGENRCNGFAHRIAATDGARAPACCTPRTATCRHRPSCRSAPPAR